MPSNKIQLLDLRLLRKMQLIKGKFTTPNGLSLSLGAAKGGNAEEPRLPQPHVPRGCQHPTCPSPRTICQSQAATPQV